MAYLALYRRYRPKTFRQVLGQDGMIRVLQNQVTMEQTVHAYLFCGMRGTGKTSVAKILARAVNCKNPQGGNPCGVCEICTMSDEALSVDIQEIDAASNNGVDEMRELREKIGFAPSICRYKVYIIDEVHMLSQGAFNALLKTLEEPPDHAKFILATTEVNKIPATILSRCQRFDFRRISEELIRDAIVAILRDLGVEYEEKAVYAIAQAAEGGLRDAQSILDQCLGGERSPLTYARVTETMGTVDESVLSSLIEGLQEGRVAESLLYIETAYEEGKDMVVLTRDLMQACTEAMVSASTQKKPVAFYLRAIELLSEGEAAMRFSLRPKVALEAAIARIALGEDASPLALVERVERLERQIREGRELVTDSPPLRKATREEGEPVSPAMPSIPNEEAPPWNTREEPFIVVAEDTPPWETENTPSPVEEETDDLPPWLLEQRGEGRGDRRDAATATGMEPSKAVEERRSPPVQEGDREVEERYYRMLEEIENRSIHAFRTIQYGRFAGVEGDALTIEFDPSATVMANALKSGPYQKVVEESAEKAFGRAMQLVFARGTEREEGALPSVVEAAKAAFGVDVTIVEE